MAVSRILFPEFLRGDDHLSRPNFSERPIPQLRDRDATNPRIDGPAVLPLFCLAPHGVFPASRITPRAVSSYLAFSTLPVLLSKNRRCLFCDTFRHRSLSETAPVPPSRDGMLPYGVRTFLQRILRFTSDHLPSVPKLAQLSVLRTKDTKVTMARAMMS